MSPPRLSTVSDKSRNYAKEYNSASDRLTQKPADKSQIHASFFYESNDFMQLPLAELEPVFMESLLRHPQISYGDVPVWSDDETEEVIRLEELIRGERADLELDEDIREGIEWFDLLEIPEFEPNDDTRDDYDSDVSGEIGEAEDLNSYASRRRIADFEGEDANTRGLVIDLLEKKYQPVFSTDTVDKKSPPVPVWFQTWLNDVVRDYGSATDVNLGSGLQSNVPDIIFYYDGEELKYEINMGILDKILIPHDAVGNINITKGSGVPVSILRYFIAKRKAALGILAEYLMQVQKKAIIAQSIPELMMNMNSIQQKDYIAYTQVLRLEDSSVSAPANPDTKKEYKKLKEFVSRTIKGKYIQLPFSEVPIPVVAFFDDPVINLELNKSALKVLKIAFDIHVNTNKGNPLTTSEQAVIISKVLDTQYDTDQVRKTLWKALRKEYHKDQWTTLKIIGKGGRTPDGLKLSDKDLEKLCEEINTRFASK